MKLESKLVTFPLFTFVFQSPPSMYGNKLSAGAGVGVVALVAFLPPVAFVGVGGVGCPVLSINEDIKPLAESEPIPVALVGVAVGIAAGVAVGCCVAVPFVVFVACGAAGVVNGGKPVGPGTVVVVSLVVC